MGWWLRMLVKVLPFRSEPLQRLRLSISGWEEADPQGDMLCWRDAGCISSPPSFSHSWLLLIRYAEPSHAGTTAGSSRDVTRQR
jgi:hypothetical protein